MVGKLKDNHQNALLVVWSEHLQPAGAHPVEARIGELRNRILLEEQGRVGEYGSRVTDADFVRCQVLCSGKRPLEISGQVGHGQLQLGRAEAETLCRQRFCLPWVERAAGSPEEPP